MALLWADSAAVCNGGTQGLIHRSRFLGLRSQIAVLGIPLQQSLPLQEAANAPREGLSQRPTDGAAKREAVVPAYEKRLYPAYTSTTY